MCRVNETMKTINSTLRTVLAIVVVAGASYSGYIGYALYNEPQKNYWLRNSGNWTKSPRLSSTRGGRSGSRQGDGQPQHEGRTT